MLTVNMKLIDHGGGGGGGDDDSDADYFDFEF